MFSFTVVLAGAFSRQIKKLLVTLPAQREESGTRPKINIWTVGSTSGKTVLANFVSEAVSVESVEDAVRPTCGARIVEFELADLNVAGDSNKVDIELWDCSGDHRYEGCWPAVRAGAHGVMLVCAPSTVLGAARELELLYNYFVSQHKLSPRQCVVLYNTGEQQDDVKALNLSSTFAKVSQVPVNIISGGNRLKIDFANYITSVIQSLNK